MSEAEQAIIKQEGQNPYVAVFVSDSEITADEAEDLPVVNSQQIIVHTDDSVAVEEFNDIHCVISQENGTFESSENEDLSNDTNRTLWTRNNVKLLINEYKAFQDEFQDPRRKQKDLWAMLSANLSEKIAKESGEHNSWMASQVTWDACDRKWRNLKHTFKTIHTNQWRSFRSRSRWEFYGPLLDIFGDNLDNNRQRKPEKTRYVIVHPPNVDGGRSILGPTTRSVGTRSTEISQVPAVIAAEDSGSGENTVILEEVKIDDGTGDSYMVVKSTKHSPSEPSKKKVKLSNLVHNQMKLSDGEDNETLNIDKECDISSKSPPVKSKTDGIVESDSVCASGSGGPPKDEKFSSPPVWFVSFLKEYCEEEKRRRDALKKAHEDIMRVELRKIKALESILSKISSGQSPKSDKAHNTRSKVDKRSS